MTKLAFLSLVFLAFAGCVSIEEAERRCAAGDPSYCPSW